MDKPAVASNRDATGKAASAPQMRIFGTADDSIVDGPGLRFALFLQGCHKRCPGCHNPQSQPFDGGFLATVDDLMATVTNNPLLAGVTLSGGEPFDQAAAVLPFASRVKHERPELTLWAYSGYLFEELVSGQPSTSALDLLRLVDVLVDGPYIEARHSHDLQWRGSANQRLIDVAASLATGSIILAL